MAKVYVSSTIADLKPERQAVLDWLRQARHQAVDSYLPDSDTVKESCLDDVAASDLYVLILGHRYGFQPPLDNSEGLSITHLEFRRAGQSDIPRIALLRTSIPDVSLSDLADPQRLTLVSAFREEVAREVRPAEFNDLQGLIQGLSTGIQGELDKRDQRDRRPGGQAMARRALRLALRPLFLAGREGLLAELEARLGVDSGAGPRVVALCGLGGAGKTSVALEYAHRHLDEVGVVWQFPAEDPAVLAAWFGELAAQLGVQDLLDTADPVALVHGVLAAYRAEWLLIFDNDTDRKAVERFLPPAGRGRVLVTSRSALWPPGQALEVPMLDAEVAADYLVRLTGDSDRQAALELAGELGGLPLALEQAAAYIQASASSLARYLVLLRQRRPDLLARGEPAGSGQTVATTWSLAFTQLERSAAAAVGLLRLLACLAPEPVPLGLLFADAQAASEFVPEVAATVRPLLGDMVAVGDAVAALRRYSLVSPAGDGLVQVHRLVQAVTADQMPGELAEAWRQAAADLIEAAIPDDTSLPKAWPACASLLPHAQVALADDSAGMARIVKYVGSRGSYAAARDLQQRVLDARERVLGPEDPDTLAARGDLALWTGEAGDPAAARDQYAGLLPVLEEALGPEHPRTLDARHELAGWTGQAGDPTAARDQFAALLPVRERVLGLEHLDSLATRHELAGWTGEAGDPAAARDLLAELFPSEEVLLGPEHPYTLWGRSDLARFTGLAGDAAAARDQFAALLQMRERVLGPEHPRTLITRSDLARWTGEAGDPSAARDQYAALLPVRERVLGPEHPDTLVTRHELARWTGEAGDAAAARDQYAALLPLRERVSGPDHPDTLAARGDLARWTSSAAGGPNTA